MGEPELHDALAGLRGLITSYSEAAREVDYHYKRAAANYLHVALKQIDERRASDSDELKEKVIGMFLKEFDAPPTDVRGRR